MTELKSEEAAYQHTLPNVYTESVTAITMLTIILISIVYQFISSLDIGCLYKIYSVYSLTLSLFKSTAENAEFAEIKYKFMF